MFNTQPHSSANFVGIVVGFLNVLVIRLVASSLPPRYLLNATGISSIELGKKSNKTLCLWQEAFLGKYIL
jgi:hypothetical protein